MKWKRTAMSLALAGCMMATTVPVTAFAAETTVASEKAATQQAATVLGTSGKWDADLAKTDFDMTEETVTLATDKTAGVNLQMKPNLKYDGTEGEIKFKVTDEDDVLGTVAADYTNNLLTINVKPKNQYDKNFKEGTATVTAIFVKDGTNLEVPFTVKVTKPIYIESISAADVAVEVGGDAIDVPKVTTTPATTTEKLGDVTYTSDDPNIATVNNGKITGEKAGTTTITVEPDSNAGITYQNKLATKFTVTVTDPIATIDVVKIEDGVKAQVSALETIEKDKTLQLTATPKGTVAGVGADTTKPDGDLTLTWSSSDSTIASVDQNGLVTAKANGNAVITVTSKNGKYATVAVQVGDKDEKATGAVLSKTSVTLMKGQKDSEAISVALTPTGTLSKIAKDGIDWKLDGQAITPTSKVFVNDDNQIEVADDADAGTYYLTAEVSVVDKDRNPYNPALILTTNACKVVVGAKDASAVTDFGFAASNATLNVNDSKEINGTVATISGLSTELQDQIVYSVDDTSVAKVVDGNLVALKPGKAYLHAKLGSADKTILITVNDVADANKLLGIKLNKSLVAVEVKGKDTSLKVQEKIGEDNDYADLTSTSYTPVWTSSDESVATVEADTTLGQAKISGKKAGTATITVTVGNYTASAQVTVIDPNAPVVPTGFVDVPANAWYANAVNTAAAKGLMNGTGNNKFEPLKTVQRSQVAAIVWNIEGAPAVTGTTPFTDVAADAWYAQAVTWAYQNKVVSGTSATTFAPNQNITRQDFAVVLYNKAGKPAASADLSKFVDASKINSWAQDAVKWAVSKGIINGNDKNELNPTGTLTRAEAASIIVKYVG